MSYILNALRKSERERQAIQPDTLADRIDLSLPSHPRNSTWLIGALIVMNLAILVYFLGFAEKTPPAVSQIAVATNPQEPSPFERPEMAKPSRVSNKESAPPKSPIPTHAKAVAPVASIPTPMPVDKRPKIEPVKPAPLSKATESPKSPYSPIPDVKTAPPAIQTAGKALALEPLDQAIAPAKADIQASDPVKYTPEKTSPLSAKSDVPFLNDLPAEFQRTLPELTINVYSYSAAVDERFVMIDMVKYVAGQRIKDSLDLKEISADGIVVAYQGRIFKIRRP